MSIIMVIIGGALVADTLFASTQSNFNLGVILPMILGTPILLYGLFFERMQELCSYGMLNIMRSAVIMLYIVFILGFAVCLTLMLTAPKLEDDKNVDALIVLGAAVQGEEMSLTLKNRVQRAVDYLNVNENTVCVVSGGMGTGENVTEASAMAKYMYDNGIDPARVIVEDRATSTYENFRFSKVLLDERLQEGYTTAYVTTDFHVYRAGKYASRAEFENCRGISVPSAWWMWPNFYLREYAAIVHSMVYN